MTGNNPNLKIDKINVYTKFGEILSICSKNTDRKQNSDINKGPKLKGKIWQVIITT